MRHPKCDGNQSLRLPAATKPTATVEAAHTATMESASGESAAVESAIKAAPESTHAATEGARRAHAVPRHGARERSEPG